MGPDDYAPTLPTSSRKWCEVVQGQEGRTGRGFGVCSNVDGCTVPALGIGEPDQRYQFKDQEARSDHSAVDVWTWREQGNVLVVERIAPVTADGSFDRS